MKKVITVFLSLLIVLSLVSCVPFLAKDKNKNKDSDSTKAVVDPTVEAGRATETNKDVKETKKSRETKEIEETSGEKAFAFEEQIIVDNDDCTIKITDIDPDNPWGYTLKAYFENKTDDRTLMFSVSTASINGVLLDPYFAVEIPAGKKSNDEINFSQYDMDDIDIGEYSDIMLLLRVYDSDDWMADDILELTAHVYPLGEDKATLFNREKEAGELLLVDNDDISVVLLGYTEDSDYYSAKLYIENKTDILLSFYVDDVAVNGFMVDPSFIKYVPPSTASFASIRWAVSDFELNDIEDVDEIELTLTVSDYEDWMADPIFEDEFILEP